MGHSAFKVTGYLTGSVAIVEIVPTAEPWSEPYVGFPLSVVEQLRPEVAMGPAGGTEPAGSSAYDSAYTVETASTGDIAIFTAIGPVQKGQALYVRCTTSKPPTDFLFGSKRGERYNVGGGAAFYVPVEEWIARASPPTRVAAPIEFHPEAVASFDARSSALVGQVSDVRPPNYSERDASFGVDLHIPDHFVIEGMLREESPVLDGRGFKSISEHGSRFTLSGDAYIEFRRLCERIQSTRSLHDTVSSSFIREHLFDWLVEERRGPQASQNYCAALTHRLSDEVATREVWVPLKNVFIEMDFPIGLTFCRTIKSQLFTETGDVMMSAAPSDEQRASVAGYVDRLRREHQGHAALVLTVLGENGRAVERALSAAQASSDVLRLYDPAVFRPDEVSQCLPYGKYFEPQERALVLKNGRMNRIHKNQLDDATFWKISRRDLADFLRLGLGKWHDTLVRESCTDLEEASLASVALFTRGATKRDLSDRIMYTFAAVESLLLKDPHEPLAQSIGDRLALAVEGSAQARIEAARLVKDVYSIRSQFVHHGAAPTDVELVGRLLQLVWRFYTSAVPSALARFTQRLDFIAHLDQLKYSG